MNSIRTSDKTSPEPGARARKVRAPKKAHVKEVVLSLLKQQKTSTEAVEAFEDDDSDDDHAFVLEQVRSGLERDFE